jgi:ribulose-5-phosphate 4-epimerase/fuculose-1-phosphate aldolase
MYETELKTEVAVTAKMLVKAKLIEGFGHVSLRTKEGFLITTTRPMKNITSKDIISYKFSKFTKKTMKDLPLEAPMHAAIYIARSDINAICRGHGKFVSTWAVSSDELPLLHGLGAIPGERVKNNNNINLITTEISAKEVAESLGNDISIILGSNGSLTTGKNLLEAATRLYFLEERARIAIYTLSTGIKLRKISKKDWKTRTKHTSAETLRAMSWFEKTFGKNKI